ncbi:hypothetical protein A7K91_24330 [Paenibacillus oryzae]|uniref:Uncharacterized protein n=2 Tax=Paenibacillus oryzae TaxID=1844972 RepID=A0A1A5YL56_9BACL|nr:hypothetical protein A7K91_24330 [Paenibacillus oryzae]
MATVMKLFIWRVIPIKRCARRIVGRNSRFAGSSGSIVLEAAIVMPLILLALLAFSLLISLCAAQMALQSAASQSLLQLSAHIRPVELALEEIGKNKGEAEEAVRPKKELPEWSEAAAGAAEWLPEPFGEVFSSGLRGDWGPARDIAATELGRSIMEPFIRRQANPYLLKPEAISLLRLTLPDLQKKEKPYAGIALTYEYPIAVPLLGKRIQLQAYAYERVWVSDALAAAYGASNNEEDPFFLQIVSINPSPVRPGRKATVVALTEPGKTISLGVMYKSGASKARNLGDATADENGYISWTWHVSGNTTPGVWEVTATAADGGGEKKMHFLVEKKQADGTEEN